ncbi:VirB4 family type IV secretion system protein [Piscibacillus sp. B03]|uniref:VirB4 family type IV secretion system protein n=1 Tax=Piscibacillus sp. B03 TaxID=3457430 RepID=UPI003FCC3803
MKLLKKFSKSKHDTSTNEQPKATDEGSSTTVDDQPTQLEMKPTFWDIISPDGFKIPEDAEDYGVMKQSLGTTTYFRPFFIPREGYPRQIRTDWLRQLADSGEIDISIDVHKMKKNEAIKLLQRQVTMLYSNLSFQTKRGNIDQIHDLQTKIQDTENLMEEIQFNENDQYHVGVAGVMYGESKRDLDRYSDYIDDEMSSLFFKVASTWNRVVSGFRTVMPLADNEIKDNYRNIDRRSLSTFAPFISGSGVFNGGVPIGNNNITGEKEFYNAFGTEENRPNNYNMAIFGESGSGKSLAVKLLSARETACMAVYSRFIDIEGEFTKITKRLGGLNLNISEETDIRINPLAINVTNIPLEDMDEDELETLEEDDEKEIVEKNGKQMLSFVPIREKMNEVLDFFDILVRGKDGSEGGLNVFERNFIEEALQYVYKEHPKFRYTTHPSSLYISEPREVDGRIIQSRVRKPEPTISDVYTFLVERYEHEAEAKRLIAALRPFLRDGSKPIFDGQTYLGKNVEGDLETARLVNFNISKMEEGFLRPIAYHVILNYIWEYFVKNIDLANKRKVVLCDEAWTLLDNDQTVSFLEKMARRSRKRNAGLRVASQDFVRFLQNDKARGILQNTYSFFFLRQNKVDLKHIQENFDLSEGELDILFGNPEPGEGIMRSGKSSVWLQTDPSNEEIIFVESNSAVLDELRQRQALHS